MLTLDLSGATSVAKHTSPPPTRQEPYYSTKNVDSSHQRVTQDQLLARCPVGAGPPAALKTCFATKAAAPLVAVFDEWAPRTPTV